MGTGENWGGERERKLAEVRWNKLSCCGHMMCKQRERNAENNARLSCQRKALYGVDRSYCGRVSQQGRRMEYMENVCWACGKTMHQGRLTAATNTLRTIFWTGKHTRK